MYNPPCDSYAFYIETDGKFLLCDSNGNQYKTFDTESTAKMAVDVLTNKLMEEHLKKYPISKNTLTKDDLIT